MKKFRADWKVLIMALILMPVVYASILDRNLEGYHILVQLMHKGTSTFYITSQEEGNYTYKCNSTSEEITYILYDGEGSEVVEGTFGRQDEGYYPYMSLPLEAQQKYKVQMRMSDESKVGTLSVRLHSKRFVDH